MRLPLTSPWLALMRMPRERLKPKLQSFTAKPLPMRLAEQITPPIGMFTSRSSVSVNALVNAPRGRLQTRVHALLARESALFLADGAGRLDGHSLGIGQAPSVVGDQFHRVAGLDVHVVLGEHAQFPALRTHDQVIIAADVHAVVAHEPRGAFEVGRPLDRVLAVKGVGVERAQARIGALHGIVGCANGGRSGTDSRCCRRSRIRGSRSSSRRTGRCSPAAR